MNKSTQLRRYACISMQREWPYIHRT